MDYLEYLFSLTGKTALVTGGATGIGTMITTALIHAGANVMICSRKGADCERVAGELNRLGTPGKVTGFGADLGSEEGIAAAANEVRSRTDTLHILFNNAGTTWGEPLDTFPYHAWAKILNLNVAALFSLTQQMLPLLDNGACDEDPARVVNLGSVMGTVAMGDGAYSYAASKAAVHHLTRILSNELSGRRITVNAFAPGPFQSKMTAFATGTPEKAERVGKGVPLGRIGAPSDIAGASLFLCGKGSAYVTGCILPLDGGIHTMTGHSLFDEGDSGDET